MCFVADSMLGKLAKWLRIMGYDTHYQSRYRPDRIDQLVGQGRRLLSRHRKTAEIYGDGVWLRSVHVGEQLAELRTLVGLSTKQSNWFSRCLVCNFPLENPPPEEAVGNVPEYVFHQCLKEIRFCPLCRRYYWRGTHRTRMLNQLREWGFSEETDLTG